MDDRNPVKMPWYYYVAIILMLLIVTYIGLFLGGAVEDPIDFLMNLRKPR